MAQTPEVYGPADPMAAPASSRRLYATAFYLWVGAAGAAATGFAFWAIVARLYDAHDVGLASAALSGLALLSLLSPLGLGLGLVRFLPESGARAPRLINAVFTSSAILAVVSSVIFLAGVPLWAPKLDFLLRQPLYGAAFIAFAITATLVPVQTDALMALRRPHLILAHVASTQLSRLILPALLAAAFGAFGIILSLGAALILGALIGFALLTRALAGYRPAIAVDPRTVRKLLPFSTANYLADLLLLAPGLLLPLLVVGLLGSEEGAYFYIAWFLGYLLTSASAQLAISLFAEGSHDPGSLLALSRNALAGGLAVAAAGALFLVFLGDKVLLAFGPDYAREGATLLSIVALAALPAAVVNVYLGALRVTKRLGELVVIAGAVALTTLGLSYVLLPVMGLEGAGIAHALGRSIGLVLVLGRLLGSVRGPMTQRMRQLFATLAVRP